MLIFRATDIPGINKSPSEILIGRKFRTNLPIEKVHLDDLDVLGTFESALMIRSETCKEV